MTNQLTIDFHGICVHFSRQANPALDLPAAHRVVIPHVPTIVSWNNQQIWIHEPTLTIGNGAASPLNGVTLSLGPLFTRSLAESTFSCPPGLRSIFPGMTIDEGVVTGQQSPAGAYFDIDEGILSGINILGSAAVRLTIDTDEPTAVLHVKEWATNETRSVAIALPASIVVANTTKDILDDWRDDFILSFAVGKPFPPPADASFVDAMRAELGLTGICVAALSQTVPGMRGTDYDLGTGCSNSHFP